MALRASRIQFLFGVVLVFGVFCLYVEFHNRDAYKNRQEQENNCSSQYVSPNLAEHVRVLCWIMTSPTNLNTRAKGVKETWGKRCQILLFMSSKADPNFPSVGLNVSEGREHLTQKTFQAFKYIYDYHYNDADWFMKADDDTYVVLENLRYFLHNKSTRDAIYFGHRFKAVANEHPSYHSGGAGYVLSKEALRRFATNKKSSLCNSEDPTEDLEMGRCLANLGVTVGNSTDKHGHSRFHGYTPETFITGKFTAWMKYHFFDGAKEDFISDYSISYHYITPERMYILEYYIYTFRLFGVNHIHPPIVLQITDAHNMTVTIDPPRR